MKNTIWLLLALFVSFLAFTYIPPTPWMDAYFALAFTVMLGTVYYLAEKRQELRECMRAAVRERDREADRHQRDVDSVRQDTERKYTSRLESANLQLDHVRKVLASKDEEIAANKAYVEHHEELGRNLVRSARQRAVTVTSALQACFHVLCRRQVIVTQAGKAYPARIVAVNVVTGHLLTEHAQKVLTGDIELKSETQSYTFEAAALEAAIKDAVWKGKVEITDTQGVKRYVHVR
jgi:hypothetical protein